MFSNANTWNLWAVAYLLDGGCSDDGFAYFRYGVIACGKHVYERALHNPDTLSELTVNEIENESFGYIAQEVYERKSGGKQMKRYLSNFQTEILGDEWDFDNPDENMQRLPKLWSKFGEEY